MSGVWISCLDKLFAENGINAQDDWIIKGHWLGNKVARFGTWADGFNMLNPVKASIMSQGLDMAGKFAKTGIFASIVTKYLAEDSIIIEKTGHYSFFIMFTIGITKGRWIILLAAR